MHDNEFIEARLGKVFPVNEILTSITGELIDLKNLHEPLIVFLGFWGCHPCEFELPILAKVSKMGKYKNYHFVYITKDRLNNFEKELSSMHLDSLGNIKVVCGQDTMIHKRKLDNGYPTMYFINSDYTVSHIETGGNTKGEETVVLEPWSKELDKLK